MGKGKFVIAVDDGRIGVVRDFKDLNSRELEGLIAHLKIHLDEFTIMLRNIINQNPGGFS